MKNNIKILFVLLAVGAVVMFFIQQKKKHDSAAAKVGESAGSFASGFM